MLNFQQDRLSIFENFKRDFQINKINGIIKKEDAPEGALVYNGGNQNTIGGGSGFVTITGENTVGFGSSTNADSWGWVQPPKQGLFSRLKSAIFPPTRLKQPKEPYFDVNKFFVDIKDSFRRDTGDTIEKQKDRIIGIYHQAVSMHQTALAQRLEQEAVRIAMEMKLIENGFPIFVEEEDIVKFCKDHSASKMKLDWIKNFARPIPGDVAEEMAKAVASGLFENYVVMHYDPEGSGTLATREEQEKEMERRRDPILFGVMSCSTRLYFIGDWEDEYCDLRLSDIIGEDERVYNHVLTSSKMIDLEAQGKIELRVKKKNPSVTVEKIT
jgi:hypothetical protein